MQKSKALGSQTAKQGFQNEKEIVKQFNHWQHNDDAKGWLKAMQYSLSDVQSVNAVKLNGHKTDIQAQIALKSSQAPITQNIQVKLVSNPNGFNQVDKRWIDAYTRMWNLPPKIISILRRYTGEEPPSMKHPRDPRRMFADEFTSKEQTEILTWLRMNTSMIVSDILKGRGDFRAAWLLIVQKNKNNDNRWILKPMDTCLNFFSEGDVTITHRGNFKIGRITMQRKGGNGGRQTAKMLQFKINPAALFKE